MMADSPLRVGILALQGAYDVHAKVMEQLGASVVLVRTPEQLDGLDGVILPGGESTTLLRHLERDGFFEALQQFVASRPTFGTCAGCILLAKDVQSPSQRSFGVLDITIERNAYGRQINSTILSSPVCLEGGPMEMVFIRAPRISFSGPDVQVLARRDDAPVLVEQNHLLAATFHPELSADTRIHQHFLDLVQRYKAA